jgi:integrase
VHGEVAAELDSALHRVQVDGLAPSVSQVAAKVQQARKSSRSTAQLAGPVAKFREVADILVFTTSCGEPVKGSSWSGAWAPAARKAGFPARTGLHCCRHLYASALIRFGESVKTVQHLLGHSSPAITLNVYAYLWPDSDDRARQAIEAAFADVPSLCPAAERT